MVGDLRDVDQAVDAGDDAGKGAELGHAHDLGVAHGAHGILPLQLDPGVVLGTLVAQGNLAVLAVQALYVHVHGIAHLQHLAGMLDAVPRQLGDVHHAVHAAQVHKGAEIGQGLHLAGVLLSLFHLLPELLLGGLALLAEHAADGAHSTAALAVDLDDAELHILAHQLVQVLPAGSGGLRGGHEDAHGLVQDDDAALDHFNHFALQHLVVLQGLGNLVPALHGVHAPLGEHDGAFLVVGLHDEQVHLVADLHQVLGLGVGVVGELARGDEASLLAAYVHVDLGGGDPHNDAVHLLVCIETLEGFLKQFRKILFVVCHFCHGSKYLLYNACGRGCPRSDANAQPGRKHRQLVRPFDEVRLAVFRANVAQLCRVRTVPAPHHNHPVAALGKGFCFFLPSRSRITYCSKNCGVCT